MFKIRTIRPDDFIKFEAEFSNLEYLKVFYSSPVSKISCIAQNCIPHYLRFIPSIHIAAEGKNILGFIILRYFSKANNSWQIDNVYVTDEVREAGLGEELLRYAISVYGSHGVEHFLAEVDSINTNALSLFQQCGFRRFAKIHFYEKQINTTDETLSEWRTLDKNLLVRPQTNNDLIELEKLDITATPPELRAFLGKSREYFKEKKGASVLIDSSRNLIVGWCHLQNISENKYLIELILSPGWTYLYEQFLNTLILDYLPEQTIITVKAPDYISELSDLLKKSGYLTVEMKEMLVKTVWQKVKERKTKLAKIGKPSIAPT